MAVHLVPFRLLADLVRVGAAFGAVAALVGIPSIGIGARCLLVLMVLMVPRAMGGVPAPLDFAFGSTLLVAVWTSTASWYETTPIVWLVHAVATGVTAVVVHRVLVAVRVLRGTGKRAPVVGGTLLVGLVVGGVWEAYRWFESIAVPVLGTHGVANLAVHLLVDGAGALVAGLVVATLCGPARTLAGPSPLATGDRVRPLP